MRRSSTYLAILLVGVFLATPFVHGVADHDYISFLGYLDGDKAWNIVNDLAGDRFEGRRAGTRGAELASEYIAGYFSSIGVRSAEIDGTYRTKFPLPLWELAQMPSLTLVDSSRNVLHTFEYRKDFFVTTGSGSGDYSAEVVFGGYGITAERLGYDDYFGISVRGKIVMAIDGTPPSDRFNQSDYGHTYKKAENALWHGAGGLILVDNPAEPTPHYVERWRCYVIGACWTIYDGLTILGGSVQLGETLLEGTGVSFDSLQRSINQALRPRPMTLGKELHVSVQARFEKHANAYNVLGFIPGSDAGSGRALVIGAHYDHWGKDVDGAIFRGADDNGSGVAVMMEIARVLSAGTHPRWPILFAAWAGEEEGLYGSYAYVEHPYFALAKTIAYLNLDMVGYGAKDTPLNFESSETYATLRAVTTKSAGQLGIAIHVTGYEGGSDHTPFEERAVPNLMLIYWPYDAYHTPRDTADYVSRENLLETSKLTTLIALKLTEATVSPIISTMTTVTTSSAYTTAVPIETLSVAGALLAVGVAAGVFYLKRCRK